MASGDTKTESLLNILGNGGSYTRISGSGNTKTQNYIIDAIDRIEAVEEEVEEMKNNPDVADIVATYVDLQAYDTQHLTDKDIIRVLTDETHDGESTYYRYSKQSGTFTYIGTSKQYSDFIGTDGVEAGVAGLVPAPATTDANKFLKSDGTWGTAGGGAEEFVMYVKMGDFSNAWADSPSTIDIYIDDAFTTAITGMDLANAIIAEKNIKLDIREAVESDSSERKTYRAIWTSCPKVPDQDTLDEFGCFASFFGGADYSGLFTIETFYFDSGAMSLVKRS